MGTCSPTGPGGNSPPLSAAGDAGSDASLTYEDAFVTETGAVQLYLTVAGGDPEAVRQRAADRPDVIGARLLTVASGLVLRV